MVLDNATAISASNNKKSTKKKKKKDDTSSSSAVDSKEEEMSTLGTFDALHMELSSTLVPSSSQPVPKFCHMASTSAYRSISLSLSQYQFSLLALSISS